MYANKPLDSFQPQDDGVRLALLARSGGMRNALREGLARGGLSCVFEGDPQQVDPGELAKAAPQAVLVALDAATEVALPRFDGVLFDPAVQVIYEDADIVLGRDAWETARWARHLAAKLQGHDRVLPPAPERAQPEVPASVAAPVAVAHAVVVPALVQPEAAVPLAVVPAAIVQIAEVPSQVEPVASSLQLEDAAQSSHVAALELVPMSEAPSEAQHIVLVLAGIGGPDALRQLVANLPAGLKSTLLVRQHLYGGRYEHLIRQLERVTSLPVKLAHAGLVAKPGQVYLVPDTVAIGRKPDGLAFAAGLPNDFAALPARGNGVVLLSGCDMDALAAAQQWADGGATLLAQAADTCFDAEASLAVQAQGGQVAAPAELAQLLARAD